MFFQFILLTLSTLFILGVGEIAVRIYNARKPIYEIEMLRYALYLKTPVQSPYATHRHLPNRSLNLMGVLFSTNSLGYRGPEPTAGRPRILVLGDSNTVGWGVREEKTFAHLIQEKSKTTEVLNAGVGNYPLLSQYGLLLEDIEKVKPKQVIVEFSPLDSTVTLKHTQPHWWNYSYLGALVQTKWEILKFQTLGGTFHQYVTDTFTPNFEDSLETLSKMQSLSKKNGARFLVIIRPENRDLSGNSPLAYQYQKTENELKRRGISSLNLFPAFQKNYQGREKELWVGNDDFHYNELAHSLSAELIYDYLKSNPDLG